MVVALKSKLEFHDVSTQYKVDPLVHRWCLRIMCLRNLMYLSMTACFSARMNTEIWRRKLMFCKMYGIVCIFEHCTDPSGKSSHLVIVGILYSNIDDLLPRRSVVTL